MRSLAGWCALAVALLRPPSDPLVSLPAQPGTDWLPALDRLVRWSQPLGPSVLEEGPRSSEPSLHDCCCPVPRLELTEAALFSLGGLLVWPALDVLWLIKLAWQRRVSALSRVLQVRPPDRP